MNVGKPTSIFAVVIHRGHHVPIVGMGGPMVQWMVASLEVGTRARLFSLYLYRKFELVCAGEEPMIPESYDGPNLHTSMTESIRIGDEYEVRVFDTQQKADLWAAHRCAEIGRDERRAVYAPEKPQPTPSEPAPTPEPAPSEPVPVSEPTPAEPPAWWMRWWPFGS